MKRRFSRCGHAPGALSPEDQAAVDQFRALLAALRDMETWTPGLYQDIAVRVGPFMERAHPRPGDDHGPDLIAVSLVHPDTPHAAAYLHGHQLGYTGKGWLRCETDKILGLWNPALTPLTHAAAGLDLPDDVGMSAAHYAVHVEACYRDGTTYTLLRLGPYNQTGQAEHDTGRLTTELAAQMAAIIPEFTVTATLEPFDISARAKYRDPYDHDPVVLLTDALAQVQ
ncbi:hypothetical protein [Streptomyces hokutonensis]|uniref:hypothetical protein n=1 Tax=Streptomyces hokutonensis TaxID=1306990 RepID=UPI000369C11B|nr:hypothetical protein [Streptomyces hokutonensis]